MIAMAVLVVVLLAASLPPGVALLLAFAGDAADRRGDRLLLAAWLGLLAGWTALLAASLSVPLAPPAFAAYIVAGAAFLGSARVRAETRRLLGGAPRAAWAAAALLLAAAAGICAGIINNRDSLGYQHDMVQWLSDTGIVPGLGLIETGFGVLSAPLAFAAIVNHGWMEARAGALPNALVLALALLHLGIALARLLQRRGRPADVLAVVALPLALAMPLALKVPASVSPDLPAVVLSVVCAWSLLVLSRPRAADAALIPLLLAAGAVLGKVSAMPLLAVAGVHWLTRRPGPGAWGRALVCGACTAVPWMAGMTLATGCPLYPSSFSLDLPWSDPETTRRIAEGIRNSAIWHQGTVPEGMAGVRYLSGRWLGWWLRADLSNVAGFALLLTALASAAVLAIRRRRLPEGGAWALAAGLAGIAYVVALAPVPRFGWGYLATPAGVLAAALAGAWAGPALPRAAARSAALLAALLVAVPALVLGRTALTASERRVDAWLAREAPAARRVYWLLPPEIPLIRYDDKAGAALTLRGHLPRAGWFEPSRRPMYYPLEPRPGIRFRDPARGAAAGFELETRGTR
ncbi:MAG: hypothetical protein FJ221_02425 [Lentisphaerae bacterium]|nr:hypothetical protein [Lentisphaerota bacterium]